MQTINLILTYGHMLIFEASPTRILPFPHYYWRHIDDTVLKGPYSSIPAATKSYDEYMIQVANLVKNNVISVNFKEKRRQNHQNKA